MAVAGAADRLALVVRTRTDLARRIAEWPEPDKILGNSWALVFVHDVPMGSDLAAIREAARLCDRVACVRLAPDKVIPPKLDSVLGQAGADIVWVPAALVGKVRVGGLVLDEVKATLLAQALLAVLPNLIVLPRGETLWAQGVAGLQESLGDMAPVKLV